MFFDIVKKIFNCVCYKCSKCLISPNTPHKDFKSDIIKILSIKNNTGVALIIFLQTLATIGQ